MLSLGKTSARAGKRPGRTAIAAATVGLVAALALAVPAGAGPSPSVTAVLSCDRGVAYQYTPGEGVAGYSVQFFRGPNGTGPGVGTGYGAECPSANGGRVRDRVQLQQTAASVIVTCWNGTIQVGSTIANLPFTGECVDPHLPGGAGRYATYQISGRPAPPIDAPSLCRDIGGTFSTDPGSDVTTYSPPGASLVWTCNDWPETYSPEFSLWNIHCTADGGDAMGFTSSRPAGGARRGISCFNQP